MSLGRLADSVLRRIVPTVDAGACVYDLCGCYVYGHAAYCRQLYTDCNGNCTRWGNYCSVAPSCG